PLHEDGFGPLISGRMRACERSLWTLAPAPVACPLKRADDGRHAVAEMLSHFPSRTAESIAQHKRGAPFRRKKLERRDEREADALAHLDCGVRTRTGRGELLQKPVGVRFDVSVDARGGMALALLEQPQADVRGN